MFERFRHRGEFAKSTTDYGKLLAEAQAESVAEQKEVAKLPAFSEAETNAIRKAQTEIGEKRIDAEGNTIYQKLVMGVTKDGTLVSIDQTRQGRPEDAHYILRVGNVPDLAQGAALAEEKIGYDSDKALNMMSGGSALWTDLGCFYFKGEDPPTMKHGMGQESMEIIPFQA